MELVLNKPELQQLNHPLLEEKQLKALVLRLDRVHPFVSGNKWYKLKYNLEQFQKENKKYLVTFGGAYSNHLAATAQAGKEFGIRTIGIVRGEELDENSNEYLRFASSRGMRLIFVTRDKYRSLRENDAVVNLFPDQIHEMYVIPEGGSNEQGVLGCREIVEAIPIDFDCIGVACGTGTTISGIAQSLKSHQRAIGISVLDGNDFLTNDVKKFTGQLNNFKVMDDCHFGGFAKSTEELDSFCKSFTANHHIPIEPVYTGKLFFGIFDLIRKDYFEKGKTVVLIHTGGIHNFTSAIPV